MNATTKDVSVSTLELERFVAAARDSLSDEMVTRLAGTLTDAIDLIDRVNRTGLAKAIPVLAEMVNNGDLERLAKLARVYATSEDALTDEMVSRLSVTVSEGISLLDQINRSGLEKAIPAIARMVNNGDLDRLSGLARVYVTAEDALNDEMVGRLAETITEGISLLDRLNRGGAARLIRMMEHMEASGALESVTATLPRLLERLHRLDHLLESMEAVAGEMRAAPAARGGLGGLWQLMRDPETQQTLQFLLQLGKRARARNG